VASQWLGLRILGSSGRLRTTHRGILPRVLWSSERQREWERRRDASGDMARVQMGEITSQLLRSAWTDGSNESLTGKNKPRSDEGLKLGFKLQLIAAAPDMLPNEPVWEGLIIYPVRRCRRHRS
jgi:hypothetical protein